MEKINTIYWITTISIAVFILWSAYTYFFQRSVIEGVRALGFPDFFRIQLAVLKIIGVFVLLTPGIPLQVKEWAYAGIGLFLITAFVAHIAHRDSVGISILLFGFFVLLMTSNIYLHKLVEQS